MRARIHVTFKPGVLDPQGSTIRQALGSMGFEGVEKVRQGKVFDIELAGTDASVVKKRLSEMCEKLLANTVIENYTIHLEDAP